MTLCLLGVLQKYETSILKACSGEEHLLESEVKDCHRLKHLGHVAEFKFSSMLKSKLTCNHCNSLKSAMHLSKKSQGLKDQCQAGPNRQIEPQVF